MANRHESAEAVKGFLRYSQLQGEALGWLSI